MSPTAPNLELQQHLVRFYSRTLQLKSSCHHSLHRPVSHWQSLTQPPATLPPSLPRHAAPFPSPGDAAGIRTPGFRCIAEDGFSTSPCSRCSPTRLPATVVVLSAATECSPHRQPQLPIGGTLGTARRQENGRTSNRGCPHHYRSQESKDPDLVSHIGPFDNV